MNKHIIGGVVAVAMLAMAVSAVAKDSNESPKPSKTPVVITDQIACVGKVVAVRESALGTAVGAYNDAVKTAYSTRASALAKAYTLTTIADVKLAIRSAWAAYSLAAKDASRTWKTARNTAWQKYTKDVRVCKAPGSISDSGRSGYEIDGH